MDNAVKTGGLVQRLVDSTLEIDKRFTNLADNVAHSIVKRADNAPTIKKIGAIVAGFLASLGLKVAGKVLTGIVFLAEGLVATALSLPVLGILLYRNRDKVEMTLLKVKAKVENFFCSTLNKVGALSSCVKSRVAAVVKEVKSRGGLRNVLGKLFTTGYLPAVSKRASISAPVCY